MLPWLSATFGSHYVFTAAHMANSMQGWCKRYFNGFFDKSILPQSSPDINPVGFVIWPILKSDVSCISYSSVGDLKEYLLTLWYNLSEDDVQKSCISDEKRLKVMVKAKVGHFKL